MSYVYRYLTFQPEKEWTSSGPPSLNGGKLRLVAEGVFQDLRQPAVPAPSASSARAPSFHHRRAGRRHPQPAHTSAGGCARTCAGNGEAWRVLQTTRRHRRPWRCPAHTLPSMGPRWSQLSLRQSPTVQETGLVGWSSKLCPRLCPNECLPSTNTVTYMGTPRDIVPELSR